MSIICILISLYKVKEFYEIKLELMEPQNQVRVETILPDLCFQGFWHLSYVDGVGDKLPLPNHESTVISILRVAASCFVI